MQQLYRASVNGTSASRSAADLMAAIPLIMRFLHAEMRRHPQRGLTVPQFRALAFVNLNETGK